MAGAFSNGIYRRLFLAQVLSLLGSGLTTMALGLLAFDLAGPNAGAVLGTALTLKMIAYVGVAPVASALAARLPRRAFLIGLDLSRAVLVLFLPFVTEIWQIYILVFAFQALSAAFTPTFQAVIPDILTKEEDYTRALSYSRLAYDLESLVSPLLTGLLLTVVSFHFLFAGTSIGFLASGLLVASVVLPALLPDTMPLPFRKRLTRGAWVYLSTPRLRGLLALYVSVAAATAIVIVNTVPRVKGELGLGDAMVAVYFAAYGVGSMAVALLMPAMLRRVAVRPVVLTGGAILTVGLVSAAFGPGFGAGLIIWSVLGAGASMIQTPSGLLITQSCHDTDRSSVFAAQFTLSHGCWLMTYPMAGYLGVALGLDQTFAVFAVIAAGAGLVALAIWPAGDPREIEHEHPQIEHEHAHGDPDHHDPTLSGALKPVRHSHGPLRHSHIYIIDDHHPIWPS
ncbi:MFS transporter [Actibacterium sp. 188UL27-1]|uniref:MFS transporter n=1 Tax=Actibacterium sp. 188UL27-1 TaxID=2786961 RepID=UPI0019585385|nr:MFS transporter [Actibacterium sp. 188UL27-1]MBM7069001.1 MFS transporter [Actibacterium sp. 188UL27-1]